MHLPTRYLYCPYDGALLNPTNQGLADTGLSRCEQCGFVDYGNPRPCVAFFIVDSGRVLLGRRAVEPAKAKWDILGGFINSSETAEAAVRREALEETKLAVQIVAYLGSIPDVYGTRAFPTLNLIYVVRPQTGDMKAQSDVAELQWFSIDQIPTELAFTHQYQAVSMLREFIGHNRSPAQ